MGINALDAVMKLRLIGQSVLLVLIIPNLRCLFSIGIGTGPVSPGLLLST